MTLKCERKMEAVSYPDTEPHFEAAIQLGNVCHTIPIHLIWGTRNDLVYVLRLLLMSSLANKGQPGIYPGLVSGCYRRSDSCICDEDQGSWTYGLSLPPFVSK